MHFIVSLGGKCCILKVNKILSKLFVYLILFSTLKSEILFLICNFLNNLFCIKDKFLINHKEMQVKKCYHYNFYPQIITMNKHFDLFYFNLSS